MGPCMNSSIVQRVLWVRGLRAFGDGYVSLLLPVYLVALGFSPFQVGAIATATLLGSGLLALVIGFRAHRFKYHTLLLTATILMALTGFGFATLASFVPLLIVAVVGTLNPSSGDVSIFLPLEHAMLAHSVQDRERTATFARYSVVGGLVAAAGALCAGAPHFAASMMQVDELVTLRASFVLYGVLGLLSALIYSGLPSTPATAEIARRAPTAPLAKSKKTVLTLAALFSLDAFAGGFVVQSMIALWLFEKYSLSTSLAGVIFFWSGVLAALSYPVAARVAERIGLINTMVFTHLPSSLFLILIPFAPTFALAIILLLARGALSQMDVPTRSSYVMAVAPPEERAAAASATSVPRSLAATISPLLAGSLLSVSTFGWPLVIAGGLKILYDVLLFARFRNLRPPEEQAGKDVSSRRLE